MRLHSQSQALGSPRGVFIPGRRAFSLIEVLMAMSILVVFAGSAMVALGISNRMAVTIRNQTQARALIAQHMTRMMTREWSVLNTPTVFTNSTPETINSNPSYPYRVTIWQYDNKGQTVAVNGDLRIWTEPDPDGVDTRIIRAELTYTFRGREIRMESSSIRARDY